MTQNLKGWKKLFVFMLIALVSLTMVVGCSSEAPAPSEEPAENGGDEPAPEEKGTIEIGYVNWAECVAASNLWKVILEEQGYEVNLTQLEVAPLYVGLNKGDLDFFLDAWLPITHESYWEEYQENLVDLGIWYESPAKIGLTVPTYVTIDSIAEMKDNADKFNSEIIGIDPGAGIMKAAGRANEDYGLGFEVVQGSEAAMMTALGKAVEKEEWIAITGWSPHWMFASYDLKYLEDPEGSFGAEEEIHMLANKESASEFAEVAEMLKKFRMNDQQIGGLEDLYINQGMTEIEAAKKWASENQDVIDGWIK